MPQGPERYLEDRERLLREAGLSVPDGAWTGDVPSPWAAWRLIIRGDAVPAARIAYGNDHAHLDEVESEWERIAESTALFGGDGEFLISVSGGSLDAPWALVRREPRMRLAHVLALYPGDPEFVAMSVDGRSVCGVTTEEYDVWIVQADIPAQGGMLTRNG
jgi:hypothetical protein